MCGISGIVGFIDHDDEQRVRTTTQRLQHRGPDDHGLWTNIAEDGFGAVLGHRRLSIIDLRTIASQPMTDSQSGCALVFNGEIYNFKELRDQLIGHGQVFVTEGDSEVILRGYAQWGPDIVPRLRGMFAFALFDAKRGRALIARDGFGIKPLYWCRTSGKAGRPAFAFASEGRALIQAGFALPHTDRPRLSRYLWNGFVPSESTIWSQIEELPRGSLALWERGDHEPRISRYWKIGGARGKGEQVQPIHEVLTRSARLHLTADVPKVVFLSGGVDSTALASMLVKEVPDLSTLSLGFADDQADESAFAIGAARAIGSRHHAVRVEADDVLQNIDGAVAALDQPSFDGTNMWFVSREAVRLGFKVAFSGTGGDEMFGGYASFRRIPRLHQLFTIMPGGIARASAHVLARLLGSRAEKLKLLDLAASRGRYEALYQSQYAMFGSSVIGKLVRQPVTELDSWGLAPERLRDLRERTRDLDPVEAVSLLESELFLSDRLLRDADSVSMDHSLEVRVPFVDTEVSDALDQLPPSLRFKPVGRKEPLRSAAAVDPAFFSRPKRGFEFPMDRWLRNELRPLIQDQLLDPEASLALGLNPTELSRIWTLYLDRPGSYYWTRIWALFVLLRWSRINNVTIQ